MHTRNRFTSLLALSVVALLGVTACTDDAPAPDADPSAAAEPVEQRTAQPRLVLTHDGGLSVVDALTLEKVSDLRVDGFTRVNPAGDGRHVFVSTPHGFRLLDTGSWSEPHGDHSHHYTARPHLTDTAYDGEKPGHVVVHDGRTALFSDGTGQVRILDAAKVGESGEKAVLTEFTVPAHHGVAVGRGDGSVIVSRGDTETRTGIEIRDADGSVVAASDDCPGLHGEAAAADGAVTFGCEDGILLVRGDEITKIAADAPYARIGNQAGSAHSPIVLGDYKTDQHAEKERPRRFSLTDTRTGSIAVVDLDTTYSFRSLGRGPAGEAIILGADGALHIFDPETRQRLHRYPVIEAWTEPDDWQDPMPDLHVIGSTVYITEPARTRLVAVSLHDGTVLAEHDTGRQNLELTGARG